MTLVTRTCWVVVMVAAVACLPRLTSAQESTLGNTSPTPAVVPNPQPPQTPAPKSDAVLPTEPVGSPGPQPDKGTRESDPVDATPSPGGVGDSTELEPLGTGIVLIPLAGLAADAATLLVFCLFGMLEASSSEYDDEFLGGLGAFLDALATGAVVAAVVTSPLAMWGTGEALGHRGSLGVTIVGSGLGFGTAYALLYGTGAVDSGEGPLVFGAVAPMFQLAGGTIGYALSRRPTRRVQTTSLSYPIDDDDGAEGDESGSFIQLSPLVLPGLTAGDGPLFGLSVLSNW